MRSLHEKAISHLLRQVPDNMGDPNDRVRLPDRRYCPECKVQNAARGASAGYRVSSPLRADQPAPGAFLIDPCAQALALIGLLAAMLPARSAVSIDPMRALRTE
jgi:hypothetical protein